MESEEQRQKRLAREARFGKVSKSRSKSPNRYSKSKRDRSNSEKAKRRRSSHEKSRSSERRKSRRSTSRDKKDLRSRLESNRSRPSNSNNGRQSDSHHHRRRSNSRERRNNRHDRSRSRSRDRRNGRRDHSRDRRDNRRDRSRSRSRDRRRASSYYSTSDTSKRRSTSDSEERAAALKSLVSLDYPYCRHHKSELDINRAYKLTQKFELELVEKRYNVANIRDLSWEQKKFCGRAEFVKIDPDDYWKMGFLSDYFNEQVRVKSRRYSEKFSPFDYWTNHKQQVIEEFERTKKEITIKELNEFLYTKVIGCNTFKAYLLTGVSKKFRSCQVLDFSSGWGDRLIGALASGIEYTGVDPNTDLFEGYSQILHTFGAGTLIADSPLTYKNLWNTYQLINEPFQTADLGTNTFDLVFTSPPYFDVEIYSDDPTQSIKEFPSQSQWEEGFLYPSLKKAWSRLRPNGHFVLILGNCKDRPDFTLKAVEWGTKNLEGAEYLGVLPYGQPDGKFGKPPLVQPMWIWKKKSNYELTKLYYIGNEKCEEINCKDLEELGKTIGHEIQKEEEGSCIYIGQKTEHTLDYGSVRVGEAPVSIKKFVNLTADDFNPKIVLHTHQIDEQRSLKIIAENLLIGGSTIQRGFDFSSVDAREIVYAAPYFGYSQVALALCAKLFQKEATVFLSKNDFHPTVKALQYGCRVHLINNNENSLDSGLKELHSAAAAYAIEKGSYMIPNNLDCDKFKRHLKSNLTTALNGVLDPDNVTATIWIVVGHSTALLSVLYEVFPKAKFAVVQTATAISSTQFERSRTTLYNAEEGFYESAHALPPYKSAIRSDAKSWQFIKRHAKDGDLLWNGAE